MTKEETLLLDFWASPFALRARIALAEKGVEFETKEEENLLGNKSELLLKSNPIYKKVPVLIHKGKPICESLVILNYIEETWPTPALLPPCAYGRSQTRFWADYADNKMYEAGSRIWKSKGEAQAAAVKEFIDILKTLEGALGEKDYFAGEKFGYLDVAIIPLTSWFYAYEQCGSFKVEDECPNLNAWIKRCLERESVAKFYPDTGKVYECVCMLKKMFGIE
ncbi:probable glutathione S-transferase [Aristolochia californica]|uniref:probable glutathione S-transferase n=1 Tax=Aristolochia californica TaxID=171875 RepID=UPI0035DDABCA